MDRWQDLDTSGHGLDSLRKHLKTEAEQWQRFEAKCRITRKRNPS
jgi:hypothetical protein